MNFYYVFRKFEFKKKEKKALTSLTVSHLCVFVNVVSNGIAVGIVCHIQDKGTYDIRKKRRKLKNGAKFFGRIC